MRAYPHRPVEELALELKDEERSLFQHVGAVSTAEPATTEERFWSRNAEKGLFCADYACPSKRRWSRCGSTWRSRTPASPRAWTFVRRSTWAP